MRCVGSSPKKFQYLIIFNVFASYGQSSYIKRLLRFMSDGIFFGSPLVGFQCLL
jgi:hypothetical protein